MFIPQCSIFKGHGAWHLYIFGFIILLLNRLLLDINITSQHGFYRDRLSRAYLIEEDGNGNITHNDRQRLSQLNQKGTTAPYHLINTVLNVPKSNSPDLRGRNADFFYFSKLFSGSELTGYCKTTELEEADPHINLGTAMAISAAAASPSMGTMTMSPFTFIMTLMNIRLNYWVPNPSIIDNSSTFKKYMLRFAGPKYLIKEALGNLSERSAKVNLSDGGHIENTAVYQLLKRHCRLIVCVDGEADSKMTFGGLSTLLRYAQIDMGIDIDFKNGLDKLRKNENGLSQRHWAIGKIQYAKNGKDPETGYLLYIKLSLTGNENEYIKTYKRQHNDFPHQSTADQFFSETQFEVYRALGEKIITNLFDDPDFDAVAKETGFKKAGKEIGFL